MGGYGALLKRHHFTKWQLETAVYVLMHSKTVRNRVLGEMRFLGVDPDTDEGRKFFEREARKYSEILLR